MLPLTQAYWQQVATHEALSADFKQIAVQAIESLTRLHQIVQHAARSVTQHMVTPKITRSLRLIQYDTTRHAPPIVS